MPQFSCRHKRAVLCKIEIVRASGRDKGTHLNCGDSESYSELGLSTIVFAAKKVRGD
jgi:hypothetical protein